MYTYSYDEETGGILLNTTPTIFSKEPRPVYADELNLLGFDKYWNYVNQSDTPYMWAESAQYIYRGKPVAKLKGGSLYDAPEIVLAQDDNGNVVEPEPNGGYLRPIDIPMMINKNREIMEIIESSTVKKILAIYEKYKNKLDIFHVAFSGGKDSEVLLDLVRKTLPKKSFVVVFGDTGMEFPDTYEAVEETKKMCEKEDVPFFTSNCHFEPNESWHLFGPPARVLRWCCSVHKSAPQTRKLREITGKNNYVGLDFVGVRKHESTARSEYDYENFGKKQKGQYSHNSILDWTSAEIWLYRQFFDVDEKYFPCIDDSAIEAGAPWENTYPHETFIELLKNVETMLGGTTKRSVWIHGAYGTGKSQCAYALKKILEVPEEELKAYWNQYEALKNNPDLLSKILGHKERGVVTAYRYASGGITTPRDLYYAIQESVKKALIENPQITYLGENTLKESVIAWIKDHKEIFDILLKKPEWVATFSQSTSDEVINTLEKSADVKSLMDNIFKLADKEGITAMSLDGDKLKAWLKDVIEKNTVISIDPPRTQKTKIV